MSKKQFLISLSLLFVFIFNVNCSRDETKYEEPEKIEIYGKDLPASSLIKGNIRIKVSESFAESLENQTDKEGNIVTANVKSMSNAISAMGIVRMERTFPYAGEFEERTRREGMHLWYDIYFDETRPVTKAADNLKIIDGIEEIEYVPAIVPVDYEIIEISDDDGNSYITTASENMPFNDPKLKSQWHYYNDGSKSNAKAGCDINVLPVWKAGITGSPDVIVSIVDGGVDFRHEDLKDNMWHNPDKTGDEVYGFNFVNNSWIVTPDEHGTHVAGTIAAVNNNGKGVCGIAGGDYRNDISGVKIMSCQIFKGKESAGSSKAIKWGADHGAVISQNSWGYEDELNSIPPSDKAAIDYFIKYAGCDKNGKQMRNSPMKGGVVIFAAGNENRDNYCYPAQYEAVFAVASVGPDFRRAKYSNYGEWVDISAPGGDGLTILSTLPNNKYGYMQGTSMACPHVSGIAALVVSKLGGPGFTNTELLNRLQLFPTPINLYNPNYNMGAGLINTLSAVMSGIGEPPDAVTDLSADANSNSVTLRMSVPRDKDSKKPNRINIYYGKIKINKNNVYSMKCEKFDISDLSVGEQLEVSIPNLEFSTKYYFAAKAVDETNNHSALSNIVNVTTGVNNPPVIIPADPIVTTMKQFETLQFKLFVYDPDNHKISSRIDSLLPGFNTTISNSDSLIININGRQAKTGLNETYVIVQDEYGMETKIKLEITVKENTPPEVIKQIDNIVFNSDKADAISLDGNLYFHDEDGEYLLYEFKASNKVSVKYKAGNFIIKPKSYGSAKIKITARDAMGESAFQTFSVLVRDGNYPIDIYPNPVTDILNVRTVCDTKATINIYSDKGTKMFNGESDTGPFSPIKINVSSFSGGVYSIYVKYEENGKIKEVKSNIVKL